MPSPQVVAGVDGCRDGWVVARLEVRPRSMRLVDLRMVFHLADVVADSTLAVIAVDMPIGLPEKGPREADRLARRRLSPHGSRVFPTPVRAACAHPDDYAAACAASRAVQGSALSRQAWHLIGKILEADALADDPRLVEVHPEVSFAESKKSAEGRALRIEALGRVVAGINPAAIPRGDDAIDAVAAAWTAARIVQGCALTLPADPQRDSRGRPMRIVV